MCERLTIGKLTFLKFEANGWKGWVAESHKDAFNDLDNWLLSPQRRVVLDLGCRRVSRHDLGGEGVYAKLMWAQNDGALAKKELVSWLKWAWGPSRSITILKNTAAMLQKGHECPVPLLGVRKKVSGGRHLNLIVTTEVSAPTLEEAIQTGNAPAAAAALAGSDLARLHADCFIHGDFLPRNACLGKDHIIYLDNDKTSHWHWMPPFFLRRRNLDQFTYNLMVQGGLEECRLEWPMAFLNAYADTAQWDKDRRTGIFKAVLDKARARWMRKKRSRMQTQAKRSG